MILSENFILIHNAFNYEIASCEDRPAIDMNVILCYFKKPENQFGILLEKQKIDRDNSGDGL
jgi:hypothetical protein